MNYDKLFEVIRELHAEKDKLDQVIANLEQLQGDPGAATAYLQGKRGRKSMEDRERKEVSVRMKKYWADKSKKTAETPSAPSAQELSQGMGAAQTEYYEAAAEYTHTVAEFSDMLDHPDGTLALYNAATKERRAATKYKESVRAFREKLARHEDGTAQLNGRRLPRILIVDDETPIRKMLLYAFTQAGYEALGAGNVEEAIKLLQREAVDAVLS
ncbi:MAG: response regulator, partial [Acidobacteriia bacterium]|nr:response regulator [Terriglobia bacterium]